MFQQHNTLESSKSNDFQNIYPALIQCFGIMVLGFLAAKFKILSGVQSSGLSSFIGNFSLPSLLFVSLCSLQSSSLNYTFLLAIFLAKSLIFFIVLIVTYLISRNPSSAGLFAIFTTQSNDLAFGYPIVKAIYGESHSDYVSYLYLLAPISLVVLNPIGFIFMEIGRSDSSQSHFLYKILKICKGIFTNPIILMTSLGVLCNYIFQSQIPSLWNELLSSLANAFGSTSLFLLGLRMGLDSSSIYSHSSYKYYLPIILISIKNIVFPFVARQISSMLLLPSLTEQFTDLSFIYGTIPAAPGVFIYATQYNVETNLIAKGVTLSTVLAGPIMFVSARLMSLDNNTPNSYFKDLTSYLLSISIFGLLLGLWCFFVLSLKIRRHSISNYLLLTLTFSQMLSCIGVVLWFSLDLTSDWQFTLQWFFMAIGIYSSRLFALFLAIHLVFLLKNGESSFSNFKIFLLTGYLIPFLIFIALLLNSTVIFHSHDKVDPNFQYGIPQAIATTTLLFPALLLLINCLIYIQKVENSRENVEFSSEEENLLMNDDNSHTTHWIRRINFQNYLMTNSLENNSSVLFRYKILLSLLCASMFIGLALSVWELTMVTVSGVFLELIFLDGILNFGQTLFTFAIFGFNFNRLFESLRGSFRQFVIGANSEVSTPNLEDLNTFAHNKKQQFLTYHISQCKKYMVFDNQSNFSGSNFVDWLLKVGLVENRSEGENYGTILINGKIILSFDNQMEFHDDNLLYTFNSSV